MHKVVHPYFNRDRILKLEMLNNLRDFPRDMLDIYTADSSSGVVCGLEPTVDKNVVTFSKGIVKFEDKVYLFHDPIVVHYEATEVEVLIKLHFLDEVENLDYLIRPVEILLEAGDGVQENQIEIGRFKLKTGAYLRSDYQDLYDFTTEYNTINVVHVPYSGYRQPTLNHLILKFFARGVLDARPLNHLDISFSMMCLNSHLVERELILTYIGYKLEEDINQLLSLSNIEVHAKLVKILDIVKKESAGLKKRQVGQRKIIMD